MATLEQREEDISRRFLVRYCAFLRQQLREQLPEWHALHHELAMQLQSLEKRIDYGPREVT